MSLTPELLVRLSTFSDMAKQIASSRSVAETISQVMTHVGKSFSPVNWSLLLRNEHSGELKFVHVTGEGAEGVRGLVLNRGQGIAGWVAENGEQALVEDTSSDPRFYREIDTKTGFVTRSIVAVPLRARGKVYGVIELINKLDDTLFTATDLHVLQTIADFAAIAIERAYFLRSLRRLAMTDPLTGLNNRRGFEKLLDREIEKTRRGGTLFALLMIDIDRFKVINDTHGHPAGDRVLKRLARLLVSSSRKVDTCARLGGDEFAVLMPGTGTEGAVFLVRRLQQKLDEDNLSSPLPFQISIGSRVVDPQRPQDVLGDADRAMYREKSPDANDHGEEGLQDVEDQLGHYLAEDGKD